jgi:hypothetical protein
MKSKPLTMFLLVAVILIWAWIMYSIFDYMGSPEQIFVKKKSFVSVVKEDSIITEYILLLNYKDPFLKNNYSSKLSTRYNPESANGIHKSEGNSQPIKKATLNTTPKEEIPIPSVSYVGRIQNIKLKKPIAILLINHNEYMMQVGEEHDGILLTQILNDSVKVIFEKKVIYVRKP